MSSTTKIEWTNATWNPVRGCAYASPGCKHCYAARQAHRHSAPGRPYAGLTQASKAGPVWTGKVTLHPELLDWPLHRRKPLRIFVNSMSDLFHEDVPDEFIDSMFAVMAACPQHVFQILTKRHLRMRDYLENEDPEDLAWRVNHTIKHVSHFGERAPWPLPNVWAGVSVEDQPRADERIPALLRTPAAIRWISAEPLLGRLNLERWLPRKIIGGPGEPTLEGLDWVVAGGESGPRARPMHPDWTRGLRDQCASAGVPFFFKQWGAWCHTALEAHKYERALVPDTVGGHFAMWRVGKTAAGRVLDGRTHDAYPA